MTQDQIAQAYGVLESHDDIEIVMYVDSDPEGEVALAIKAAAPYIDLKELAKAARLVKSTLDKTYNYLEVNLD